MVYRITFRNQSFVSLNKSHRFKAFNPQLVRQIIFSIAKKSPTEALRMIEHTMPEGADEISNTQVGEAETYNESVRFQKALLYAQILGLPSAAIYN